MRSLLVINDCHLGVQRTAGTTPASAAAIRSELQDAVRQTLLEHRSYDVLINGDLFDGYNVPMSDVLGFIDTANEFAKGGSTLYLARGNHDISRDSTRLSSFDFVCEVLTRMLPEQVEVIRQPRSIDGGCYVVPHAANQDIFDDWLAAVPDDRVVFLHANADNQFAQASDHSLNVSEQQMLQLVKRGCRLVFAHEHQQRQLLNGKVVVVGNQWPSSIADCLGNDSKRLLIVHPDNSFEFVDTWHARDSYTEIDWRSLPCEVTAPFVRVIGNASSVEAPDAVSAIARLRQKNDAFVIGNAVVVEGVEIGDAVQASVEAVQGFDVLAFLLEKLSAEHAGKLRELLNAHPIAAD